MQKKIVELCVLVDFLYTGEAEKKHVILTKNVFTFVLWTAKESAKCSPSSSSMSPCKEILEHILMPILQVG